MLRLLFSRYMSENEKPTPSDEPLDAGRQMGSESGNEITGKDQFANERIIRPGTLPQVFDTAAPPPPPPPPPKIPEV